MQDRLAQQGKAFESDTATEHVKDLVKADTLPIVDLYVGHLWGRGQVIVP